jgi:hypothetical protein
VALSFGLSSDDQDGSAYDEDDLLLGSIADLSLEHRSPQKSLLSAFSRNRRPQPNLAAASDAPAIPRPPRHPKPAAKPAAIPKPPTSPKPVPAIALEAREVIQAKLEKLVANSCTYADQNWYHIKKMHSAAIKELTAFVKSLTPAQLAALDLNKPCNGFPSLLLNLLFNGNNKHHPYPLFLELFNLEKNDWNISLDINKKYGDWRGASALTLVVYISLFATLDALPFVTQLFKHTRCNWYFAIEGNKHLFADSPGNICATPAGLLLWGSLGAGRTHLNPFEEFITEVPVLKELPIPRNMLGPDQEQRIQFLICWRKAHDYLENKKKLGEERKEERPGKEVDQEQYVSSALELGKKINPWIMPDIPYFMGKLYLALQDWDNYYYQIDLLNPDSHYKQARLDLVDLLLSETSPFKKAGLGALDKLARLDKSLMLLTDLPDSKPLARKVAREIVYYDQIPPSSDVAAHVESALDRFLNKSEARARAQGVLTLRDVVNLKAGLS